MRVGFLTLLGLASVLWLGAIGCHSTLEGGLRAGLPGKDTIVSRYETSYENVHEAAVQVLKDSGTLTSDDHVKKVLRGNVDNNVIWIKLDDTEPRIITVSVEARTSGGAPNVDMASEISKRIYGQLIIQ